MAALIAPAATAAAVPQSKLDQARAVKGEVDRLRTSYEVSAERYHEASSEYSRLTAERRRAQAKLRRITKRQSTVQRHLDVRAGSMYRSGPLGIVSVLLGAESFQEFAATWDLLSALNRDDASNVAELKGLRAEAKQAAEEISAKERAAKEQAGIKRSAEESAERDFAQMRSKLRGIESEIAALEAAERRAALARAAAEEALAAATSRSSQPASNSYPPPRRAPRSEVVAIAKQYIGVPYSWGGSSPSTGFDCSGFTSYVYRQVGVSLPRVSRFQINAGERVNRADLQPGDLVFFGSPIHHVGMYIGGGQYIHSPHAGASVRIDALASHGDYVGASRP